MHILVIVFGIFSLTSAHPSKVYKTQNILDGIYANETFHQGWALTS